MREPLCDITPFEDRIFKQVQTYAYQSPESLVQLIRAVRYLIENDIAGDFVECGVFMGASVVCMIRTQQAIWAESESGTLPAWASHDIWLYDTFQGMPRPDKIDVFRGHKPGEDIAYWERHATGDGGSNWARATMEAVQENVNRTGYPRDRLHYIKGMVEHTIPGNEPDRIALLRLDTDFYSSTKHELVHLYPRVVSGGVIIIDDYGAFAGARKAVDEYIAEQGLKVLLARIDEHVRMWVKP